MVSFPPQQNNKNGINLRLVSRAGGDGGEPCHPLLNYSIEREKREGGFEAQPINFIIITRALDRMHQLSPPLPQAWKLSS